MIINFSYCSQIDFLKFTNINLQLSDKLIDGNILYKDKEESINSNFFVAMNSLKGNFLIGRYFEYQIDLQFTLKITIGYKQITSIKVNDIEVNLLVNSGVLVNIPNNSLVTTNPFVEVLSQDLYIIKTFKNIFGNDLKPLIIIFKDNKLKFVYNKNEKINSGIIPRYK